jgi:hypothetical protein
MTDWLISLVPWWAWLALAVTAVVVVYRLLGWRGALAAAAGLMAVIGYGKGRHDESLAERNRRDRENLKASQNRKEIDDAIDQLGSNDLDERYSRWMRDDDTR